MNINIHPFSNYAISLFRETVLSSLAHQRKKILVIASIVFGCLFAYCWKSRYNYKGTVGEEGKTKISSLFGLLVREGEFKDDELNGQGKSNCLFGLILEEGEFKDGVLNGQGKLTHDSSLFGGGVTVREGEFKDGKLNGLGKITRRDGKYMRDNSKIMT